MDEQSKSKAQRFTASTLSPYHGSLRKRLELSFVHMPVQPEGKEKNQVCQLHRWAYRRSLGNNQEQLFKNSIPDGARKNVMYYKICDVKICLWYWKIFHTCAHLERKIETILKLK